MATENITGPDPRESDDTEREYEVVVTITITRTTTSSNLRLPEEEERLSNEAYRMLAKEGFDTKDANVICDFYPK